VNTGVLWPELDWAESQVLRIQTKLHQRATEDHGRRFDDLFILVCDPAVLTVAWARVRGNRRKPSPASSKTASLTTVAPPRPTRDFLEGCRSDAHGPRKSHPNGCARVGLGAVPPIRSHAEPQSSLMVGGRGWLTWLTDRSKMARRVGAGDWSWLYR